MKRGIYIVLFLLLPATHHAQLLDTLRDLFNHKYTLDVRLESRNSIIKNELTCVRGIRGGISFKRKLRLGGGISWLKTDGHFWLPTNVTKDFYVKNADGTVQLESRYLKFFYICHYVDFVFYKTKRWQLSVPIQLGTGYLWFQKDKEYSLKVKDPKYLLFFYEPGITLQYKLFKWFGVGADVTYRFAIQDRKKTGMQLSNLSLTFKTLIYFDQIFYELFPKHEITTKYGPAYW